MNSPTTEHNCEICGKTFRFRSHLKRHSLVHSEEKPFECSICEGSSRRKDVLRQHMIKVHKLEGEQLEVAMELAIDIKTRRDVLRSVQYDIDEAGSRRSMNAPKRSRYEEEEDSEATSDDYGQEFSTEIDAEQLILKLLNFGKAGNQSIQDEIEEKPRVTMAPWPETGKIDNRVKTEQNLPVIQEFRDLPSHLGQAPASQQGIPAINSNFQLENSILDNAVMGPAASVPVTQQFAFDEDIRYISNQLSRVATTQPECQGVLRQILFETIVTVERGGFNNDIGEFFKKLSDRFNN